MKTRKTEILCLEIRSLDMEGYPNILHSLIIITKNVYYKLQTGLNIHNLKNKNALFPHYPRKQFYKVFDKLKDIHFTAMFRLTPVPAQTFLKLQVSGFFLLLLFLVVAVQSEPSCFSTQGCDHEGVFVDNVLLLE